MFCKLSLFSPSALFFSATSDPVLILLAKFGGTSQERRQKCGTMEFVHYIGINFYRFSETMTYDDQMGHFLDHFLFVSAAKPRRLNQNKFIL